MSVSYDIAYGGIALAEERIRFTTARQSLERALSLVPPILLEESNLEAAIENGRADDSDHYLLALLEYIGRRYDLPAAFWAEMIEAAMKLEQWRRVPFYEGKAVGQPTRDLYDLVAACRVLGAAAPPFGTLYERVLDQAKDLVYFVSSLHPDYATALHRGGDSHRIAGGLRDASIPFETLPIEERMLLHEQVEQILPALFNVVVDAMELQLLPVELADCAWTVLSMARFD